jgi:hypothetical protein
MCEKTKYILEMMRKTMKTMEISVESHEKIKQNITRHNTPPLIINIEIKQNKIEPKERSSKEKNEWKWIK